MYLPAVTYDAAVSFVLGYDIALDGGLLLGFHEWLIPRLNKSGHGNMAWPWLVLEIIGQPEIMSVAAKRKPTEKQQLAALEGLFNTIETFMRERNQFEGARRIFAAYEHWLHKQDWYDSSSPRWIPPATRDPQPKQQRTVKTGRKTTKTPKS